MWTSVPQIVVSVTRTRASPGPGFGRGTSRSSIFPFSTNTAARIVGMTVFLSGQWLGDQAARPGGDVGSQLGDALVQRPRRVEGDVLGGRELRDGLVAGGEVVEDRQPPVALRRPARALDQSLPAHLGTRTALHEPEAHPVRASQLACLLTLRAGPEGRV